MLQYGGGGKTGTILIRSARQLLTLRGARGPRRGGDLNELGIIHDGALLIRDGVLQEVPVLLVQQEHREILAQRAQRAQQEEPELLVRLAQRE